MIILSILYYDVLTTKYLLFPVDPDNQTSPIAANDSDTGKPLRFILPDDMIPVSVVSDPVAIKFPAAVMWAVVFTLPDISMSFVVVKPPDTIKLPVILPVAALMSPVTAIDPVIECDPVKCLKLLSSSKFVKAEPFIDLYVSAICFYLDATTISNNDDSGYAFAFIVSIPTKLP